MNAKQIGKVEVGALVLLAEFEDQPEQVGELLSNVPDNGTVMVRVHTNEPEDDGLRECGLDQVLRVAMDVEEQRILEGRLNRIESRRGRPNTVAYYADGIYDGEAEYLGDGGEVRDILRNLAEGNTVALSWDDADEESDFAR